MSSKLTPEQAQTIIDAFFEEFKQWQERVECLESDVEDIRGDINDLLNEDGTENDLETLEPEDYTDYEDSDDEVEWFANKN